jgi:tetratricopeptide (TPR) repeat protein
MKKLVFFLLLTSLSFGQERMKKIMGQVTYMETPLVQAEVRHVASGESIKTDVDGRYEVMASPGDILQYTYPSMRTLEIVVEDVTRILNITLSPMVNELDEVVVTKRRTQSQSDLELQYRTDKSLIRTAFGIVDTKVTPYRIPMLNGEDFILRGVDLFATLNGKFAGLVSRTNPDGSGSIFMRGGGSINNPRPMIYDVDGQIFNELPLWLFPENIQRLAVIPGLAGVTNYGSMGAGGVLVINTVASVYGAESGPYDHAKLRTNKYDGKALSSSEVLKNAPTYYQELHSAKDVEGATAVFGKYLTAYRFSSPFVLDVFKKLNNGLQQPEAAATFLEEHGGILQDDPVALKALAYIYQANGQFSEANKVYKDIFLLRPNYGQSYLDMANSYREIREYQKAASIYGRYGYLLEQGFLRAEGDLGTIMDRELNNLVALEGRELLDRRELKKLVLDDEFQGTRIVFEWNDSEAEFELQFVNPEGHYYKSEYSLLSSPERIKDGKLSGFSTEEYLVDESLKGLWQVNATYFGNKSLTPTYLKATIYHNYGSMAQRKETRVFKLFLRNVNQQLFTVSNAVGVASN